MTWKLPYILKDCIGPADVSQKEHSGGTVPMVRESRGGGKVIRKPTA